MWNRRFFQTSALLAAGVSLFALSLAAQDAPSVAEAARRAREQKKASTKPATVITDDTLHPSTATPATPGPNVASSPAPGQAESAAPAALENTAAAEGAAPSEGAEKKAKVDALKQQIAQAQIRVNMLQREIALAQDNLYRNPDYVHDTAGKEKLASLQDDLQQGQTELADLKAKITDLGGSAEEPKETAPPAASAPPAQPQP